MFASNSPFYRKRAHTPAVDAPASGGLMWITIYTKVIFGFIALLSVS